MASCSLITGSSSDGTRLDRKIRRRGAWREAGAAYTRPKTAEVAACSRLTVGTCTELGELDLQALELAQEFLLLGDRGVPLLAQPVALAPHRVALAARAVPLPQEALGLAQRGGRLAIELDVGLLREPELAA